MDAKEQNRRLRCLCGCTVSLYFCERLDRYVCPVCQEKEYLVQRALLVAANEVCGYAEHRADCRRYRASPCECGFDSADSTYQALKEKPDAK